MKNLGAVSIKAMAPSSPLSSSSSPLPIMLIIFSSSTLLVPLTSAYFADWSSFAERDRQPTCVDIPSNMTLCQNIGGTLFSEVF